MNLVRLLKNFSFAGITPKNRYGDSDSIEQNMAYIYPELNQWNQLVQRWHLIQSILTDYSIERCYICFLQIDVNHILSWPGGLHIFNFCFGVWFNILLPKCTDHALSPLPFASCRSFCLYTFGEFSLAAWQCVSVKPNVMTLNIMHDWNVCSWRGFFNGGNSLFQGKINQLLKCAL